MIIIIYWTYNYLYIYIFESNWVNSLIKLFFFSPEKFSTGLFICQYIIYVWRDCSELLATVITRIARILWQTEAQRKRV